MVPPILSRLRLPVIGAPLFIVSNPKLVIAQCKAGVVGSFPALNARPAAQLDEWIHEITEALAEHDRKNPNAPSAPFAVNQIVHRSNDRFEHDMQVCAKWEVPIVITSLGAREELNQAVHSWGGITLHELTGSGVWDGIASILIGVLLVGVAISLGTTSKRNLIGEALPQSKREGLTKVINDSPGVDVVVELLTMRLGPDDVLVAARVDVDDTVSGGDLEQVADDVDLRIREAYPEVRHVFLDPTSSRGTDSHTSESTASDSTDSG